MENKIDEKIEEAAIAFGKSTSYFSVASYAFKEGAMSQAAKDYWFKQFSKPKDSHTDYLEYKDKESRTR